MDVFLEGEWQGKGFCMRMKALGEPVQAGKEFRQAVSLRANSERAS